MASIRLKNKSLVHQQGVCGWDLWLPVVENSRPFAHWGGGGLQGVGGYKGGGGLPPPLLIVKFLCCVTADRGRARQRPQI